MWTTHFVDKREELDKLLDTELNTAAAALSRATQVLLHYIVLTQNW